MSEELMGKLFNGAVPEHRGLLVLVQWMVQEVQSLLTDRELVRLADVGLKAWPKSRAADSRRLPGSKRRTFYQLRSEPEGALNGHLQGRQQSYPERTARIWCGLKPSMMST